ncbi:hypothetical protein EV368DRAFT_85754 [Lentinula lateritia]|nr:hypothetical protein EV368DRAFT_85754 [Lentinula lateritia]
MLIAVLLHTFVGTVAGTPQGPIIISCRGPNDHSAKYSNLVTYAGAKALKLGKCINGPSGVSASHPRLPALLNLPSPASGPATSSSTSLTYTHSQPGFIPIHTPPLLSRAIPNPAPSTFQKLYHAADFDSLTSCKSVAPLSEESGGAASTAPLNALNLMEGTSRNQSRATSCPALVADTSTSMK